MKITGKELAEQVDPSSVSTGSITLLCLAADKEYEIKESMYCIPLPGLSTTDGYPQFLSRKRGFDSWFASRDNRELQQGFTQTELDEEVPESYRSLAKRMPS